MAAARVSVLSPAQTWAGATTRSTDGSCNLIRTFPQTRHGVSGRWGDLSGSRPWPKEWSGREPAPSAGLP